MSSDVTVVQIMAGLRKHVVRSELEGSHVVVILNLKTARLAGAESDAVLPAGRKTQQTLDDFREASLPPFTCSNTVDDLMHVWECLRHNANPLGRSGLTSDLDPL